MKTFRIIVITLLTVLSFISCRVEPITETLQKRDISEFLGQWTIDIQGGSVGWLEIRQEENSIDADLLWGGGSVLPVSNVFLAKDEVLIVQRSNVAYRNIILTPIIK